MGGYRAARESRIPCEQLVEVAEVHHTVRQYLKDGTHESGEDRCTRHDHPLCPAQGRGLASITADATYGNGEFLQWLLDRGITPYMRTRDSALRKNNPGYGPERFIYLPESYSYRCPAGEQLNYVGLNARNRVCAYIDSAKRCGGCSQKAQCASGRYKYLAIHIHESARQRARELANTPEFATAQRQERRYGICKRGIG